MKKFLAFLICVFMAGVSFAQSDDNNSQESVYSYQVYGQTFEIFEYCYRNYE